jgi:hypothetical protein
MQRFLAEAVSAAARYLDLDDDWPHMTATGL